MNAIDKAVKRACEEPTLTKALSLIALWECERVIPEAHAFLSGKKERNADGTGWSTCFEYLIARVMKEYPQ